MVVYWNSLFLSKHKCRQLLLVDWTLRVRKIVEAIDISYVSVVSISNDDLGMATLSVRCVSLFLTIGPYDNRLRNSKRVSRFSTTMRASFRSLILSWIKHWCIITYRRQAAVEILGTMRTALKKENVEKLKVFFSKNLHAIQEVKDLLSQPYIQITGLELNQTFPIGNDYIRFETKCPKPP